MLLIAMAYTDAHLSYWGSLPITEAQNGNVFGKTAVFIKTLFRDNRAYPMFAFLFGYGSVLLFQKMEPSGFDKKKILKKNSIKGILVACFRFFSILF